MSRRAASVALLVLVTAVACGGQAAPQAPAARAVATAGPASPPPGERHVFVIVMENKTYAEAMAQPYTASLGAAHGLATNYRAITYPSLPNYLALTAGSTFDLTDNGYRRLPETGIGHQLTERGIPWRAYMEGMTRGCFDSPPPYALKHNPFAYYGGRCPANVVALTALDADLAGDTPHFVWITPDLCHSGHDCGASVADRFLAALVPKILSSRAWQQDGLLLLTWDEDGGGADNRVPAIVATPGLAARQTARPHTHYSSLAMIQDRLGLPRLGHAAQAQPLLDDLCC